MSLSVKNLSFSYEKNEILKNITSDFNIGKITVIAGPNGAGKSTLVKSIMTLLNVNKDSIFIDGKDINSFHIMERSRILGYVAQNSNYNFDFSVYEIVEMGRYPFKKMWDMQKDKLAIEKALRLTETYGLKERSINSLSGGELQRVLLARALAGEPKYLILDEPASNLDISHNIHMMKLIKNLTSSLKITTVMVLHDLNSMLEFGDQIIILKNGDLKLSGSIKEVLIPINIKKIFGVDSQIIQDKNGRDHILLI